MTFRKLPKIGHADNQNKSDHLPTRFCNLINHLNLPIRCR